MNEALEARGHTWKWSRRSSWSRSTRLGVAAGAWPLIGESGRADTPLILGGNPVFTAPTDLGSRRRWAGSISASTWPKRRTRPAPPPPGTCRRLMDLKRGAMAAALTAPRPSSSLEKRCCSTAGHSAHELLDRRRAWSRRRHPGRRWKEPGARPSAGLDPCNFDEGPPGWSPAAGRRRTALSRRPGSGRPCPSHRPVGSRCCSAPIRMSGTDVTPIMPGSRNCRGRSPSWSGTIRC